MREIVHIIDDDPSIREALAMTLDSVSLASKGYGSVMQYLESMDPQADGCLLLDVRLPGMSGLDFLEQFPRHRVPVPAVMMSGHADIQMTVRAMKAGAIDFLTKPFREQDVLDAVYAALEADRESKAQQRRVDTAGSLMKALSEREREVLQHASDGLQNKQIAFELGLSEITVKIHRSTAMKKLGLRTLPDLVRMMESLKRASDIVPPHVSWPLNNERRAA